MNSLRRTFRYPSFFRLGFWCLPLLAGCNRDDVQVYRVAKDTTPPGNMANAGMPQGHPDMVNPSAEPPQLEWTLPPGWQQVEPGEMRVASFRVQDGGKQAELGVVPLPGLMGRDLESVNRWRSSVGMPPVKEEELPGLAQKVPIADQTGDLYEQAGENPGSGDKTRVLAAVMRRQGVAWFLKFTGDDELVTREKPAFLAMLKSLKFTGGAGGSETAGSSLPPSHPPIGGSGATMTQASAQSSSASRPNWQVPAGWTEAPAGQFLAAKFTIAGTGNAQAAVNVSTSAGTGGGLAGNINRWRGQLGLGELSEAEIGKLVTPLELPEGKAMLVDLAGTDARTSQKSRLIGAIVPRDGATWFYKLMGDEQLVGAQKDAFTQFIRTAAYK